MKISTMGRRQFTQVTMLFGLAACVRRPLAPGAAVATARASGNDFDALGPFNDRLTALFRAIERGEISDEALIREVSRSLQELELEHDVMEEWQAKGSTIDGAGGNGYRIVHDIPLVLPGPDAGSGQAILFYTPPGISNPPHEHHNLISTKRILLGSYHVRQYERVREVEPGVVAIRQVTERPAVGYESPCVEMRDNYRAAHWFGSTGDAVLALNIAVKNPLPASDTFYGADHPRESGRRFFIDPTVPERDADGNILARSIEWEEAEAFTQHLLTDFPAQVDG